MLFLLSFFLFSFFLFSYLCSFFFLSFIILHIFFLTPFLIFYLFLSFSIFSFFCFFFSSFFSLFISFYLLTPNLCLPVNFRSFSFSQLIGKKFFSSIRSICFTSINLFSLIVILFLSFVSKFLEGIHTRWTSSYKSSRIHKCETSRGKPTSYKLCFHWKTSLKEDTFKFCSNSKLVLKSVNPFGYLKT